MRVLAISAHPDDETLGCGGTLLRHGADGDELYWLVATEGYEPVWSRHTLDRKAGEVQAVADAYGMRETFKLGLPAARLDTVPQADLIAAVEDVIARVQPEIVYLVSLADVHTDHHALYRAAMAVMKPFHMARHGVRRILTFETLSSTDAAPLGGGPAFKPTVLVDVTPHIDRKIEIMGMFGSEAQSDLLPRGDSAIRALARFRGSTCGVEYAEAFVLVHELIGS